LDASKERGGAASPDLASVTTEEAPTIVHTAVEFGLHLQALQALLAVEPVSTIH
jgi:hypothetical protein